MYQALYRKYRPRVFDDIVGQEHITSAIKNEIAFGRTSHAYLFTGSRGTGKTTLAKIISRAVCCENPANGNPCGECKICKGIEDGSILDVLEIDAASNNSVDDIRQLREEAFFLPATAKFRVYIIDEAHMLSVSAFNALLKIMEEPPAHVIFILATTEVHKIPATILSRCQRFDFKRIPAEKIKARVEFVCEQENINITSDAADLISRLADGGMRDALSILDICRAFSEEITEETVSAAMGMSSDEMIFSIADAVSSGNIVKAMEVLDEMHSQSADFSRISSQLLEHFRLLMLVKASKTAIKSGTCTKEKEELLKKQSERFKMSHILYCIEVLSGTMSKNFSAAAQKTIMETALIKMADPSLDDSQKAILARLDSLEKKISRLALSSVSSSFDEEEQPKVSKASEVVENSFKTETKTSSERNYPKEETNSLNNITEKQAPMAQNMEEKSFIQKQEINQPKEQTIKENTPKPQQTPKQYPDMNSYRKKATEFEKWGDVLSILEKANPALFATLTESKAYESENYMLIDCKNDFFFTLMREDKYAKKSIREALYSVTGKRFNLGPYKKEKYEAEEEPKENPFLEKLAQAAVENGVDVNIK